MTDFKQPHSFCHCCFKLVQGQVKRQQYYKRVEFSHDRSIILPSIYINLSPFSIMSDSTDSNKPVKSFRLRGITAGVFENETEEGNRNFFKVTLQRSYKQDDQWKSTNSFGRDDLPIVSLLTKQAWEFILTTETNSQKEEK